MEAVVGFKHNALNLIAKLKDWGSPQDILIGLCASSFFINLLALVFPLVLLQTYDRIIPNASLHTLVLLIIGVGSALILEALLRIGRAAVSAWADARFEFEKGTNAFKTLLSAHLEDYEKEGFGTHLERLNSLNTLKDFYGSQAITTLFDLPFVILYLLLIAYLGGFLVIIPLMMLVVFSIAAMQIGSQIRTTLEQRRRADERRINFIIEVLNGIHTIKSMAMEALMLRRYERLQKGSIRCDYDLSFKSANAIATSSFISQLTLILVVCFGSIIVIQGHMSIGGLAACTLLASRSLQPMSRAINVWKRLQAIFIAEKRLEEITKMPAENTTVSTETSGIQGALEFRHVSFQHDTTPLFKDVNFSVKAGQVVSISGDGMSGKSTLLSMILGIVRPKSGEVLIDGKELSQYNLQQLRQQITYLPQHGTLFDGTILENMTLFSGPQATAKAKQIAARLGIDAIINRMPMGYETIVGNRAVDILSRGVKQRICIARALMTDAKILLFDEANASIDIQADTMLIDMLLEYKGKCTMILVSHRPSLTKLACQQYFLSEGVLKVGKHV